MLPVPDLSIKPDPTHEVAYLAGFFDGEGCIRVACNRGNVKRGCTPRYYLVMIASQKAEHKEPLEMLKARYGGWLGLVKVRKNCKPVMQWQIQDEKAAIAMTEMMPYLIVKRAAAYAGLIFFHWKEVMRTTRKAGQKLSDFEVDMGGEFTKLFYIINGNKPLYDESISPPVQSEAVQ